MAAASVTPDYPAPAPPAVEHRDWRVWDAVLALLAGIAASIIVVVIIAVVAGREPTDAELFGFVFMAQSLGTLGVLWLMGRSRGTGDIVADLGIRFARGDLLGIPIGLGIQLGLGLVMLPLLRLLDVDGPTQEVGEAAQDANTLVAGAALVLAVAVMAPLTEEIVFRGVLLRALLRKYGENAAVLISAAGFAVVHLLDPGSYLIVPALFVVGVVLAALRMQRDTLGLVIMVHVGFNLTAVVGLLVPQ